jgi:hypothetical protein
MKYNKTYKNSISDKLTALFTDTVKRTAEIDNSAVDFKFEWFDLLLPHINILNSDSVFIYNIAMFIISHGGYSKILKPKTLKLNIHDIIHKIPGDKLNEELIQHLTSEYEQDRPVDTAQAKPQNEERKSDKSNDSD